MVTIARRALPLTIALLVCECSEVSAPPTVGRVAFDRHTATLWASDVLVTSVSVFLTSGDVVANPSLTYTSSNDRVATVDSRGTVETHSAGQATITAGVGSIMDELNVTVVWPPVTTVVFEHDSLVASVGDMVAGSVIVLNAMGRWAINAPLTYSSSAPGIATVDGTQPPGCPWVTCSFEPRMPPSAKVERQSP